MSKPEAHRYLDRARAGKFVNQRLIDAALRVTGDLDKKAPPLSKHVFRRMPSYA